MSNIAVYGVGTTLVARNLSTGDSLWTYDASGISASDIDSTAINENGIWFISGTSVVRLSLEGAHQWTTGLARSTYNVEVTSDNHVIAGQNQGKVSILNPDGSIRVNASDINGGNNRSGVVTDDDRIYITSDTGGIRELDLDATVLNSANTGDARQLGLSANDSKIVAAGSDLYIYDLDLTTLQSTVVTSDIMSIAHISGDTFALHDDGNDDLEIFDASDESITKIADLIENSGNVPNHIAATPSIIVSRGDAPEKATARDISGTFIWSHTESASTKGFSVLGVFGPTTNEELFQASYADASAADPKVTALIRPADVQRSIDTDVSNLKDGPNLYTVEAIFDIGELSDLNPYNATTEKPRVFFVQDDQPGLREGKNLLLKSYTIRDADPAVPVTCTFWG